MRRSNGQPGGRLAWPASILAIAAVSLLAAACTATPSASGHGTGKAQPGSHAAQAANATRVTISPGSGVTDADPSAGITVTAAHGRLKSVTVHTARGGSVSGSLSDDGTVWHSTWALAVSRSYTVTATASGGSRAVTATSTFRTLTPSQTFRTEIFEGYRQRYGVGMPVILTFSRPIIDKAAVERSLQLRTSTPVVGAWYWDGDQTVDFRPRNYWPAGTTVSFTGHLNGVQGAPGVYGTHTLTQTFHIGASLVAIANTRTHYTKIYYNGKLRYDWPISTGKPGDAAPDGSYLTIEKHNPVQMTGPGYSLSVPWSVRFTFSGDYYHDAYWSVSEQGFENVSHGCVNLSPGHAETYYKLAVPGDPITVVGSPKGGTWDNGWTEWFLSWRQYVRGSALDEAVMAGPNGSTFVSPASVPASTARAPLGTAPAGNSRAR
jgi:lipoprotein-anchoring transpeptidase ErfK/SrfK